MLIARNGMVVRSSSNRMRAIMIVIHVSVEIPHGRLHKSNQKNSRLFDSSDGQDLILISYNRIHAQISVFRKVFDGIKASIFYTIPFKKEYV